MFFTLNHLEITKFASLNLFETQTGAVTVLCPTFPSCHLARSAFPPPVSHFCTLLEHAAAARYRRKRDLRVSCSVWLQLLLRSYITAGSALRATSRSPAFENTLLFKTPWEIVWGGIELPRLCLVERPLCTYEIVCSFLFIYLFIHLFVGCVCFSYICVPVCVSASDHFGLQAESRRKQPAAESIESLLFLFVFSILMSFQGWNVE